MQTDLTSLNVYVILPSKDKTPRRIYSGSVTLAPPDARSNGPTTGFRGGDHFDVCFAEHLGCRPITIQQSTRPGFDFLLCPSTPAVKPPLREEDRSEWNSRLRKATQLSTWTGEEEEFFAADWIPIG